MVKRTKAATSMRLSAEARALLAALSERYGINQTAVMEMALRTQARQEGIKVQEKPVPDSETAANRHDDMKGG